MATTAPAAVTTTSLLPLAALGDDALAGRVRAGDEAAFEALYRRYHADLSRYCASVLGDPHDAEEALQGALTCKFRNSGQTCISANRVLVQEGIYDDFLAAYTTAVERLVVADGFTEGVDVGPLIDRPALEKVERHTPDVVVLDLEMPGMDGFETLRRLKQSNPKLPILIFSSRTKRFCSATSRSGSPLASAGAISFFTTAYETKCMSSNAARAPGGFLCSFRAAVASCSSSSVSTHITRITNESARNSGPVQAA